jgi:hypothetical protein
MENGVCLYRCRHDETKSVPIPQASLTPESAKRTKASGWRACDVIFVPVSGQNDIVIELMSVATPEASVQKCVSSQA